jgi:hypothetical protein
MNWVELAETKKKADVQKHELVFLHVGLLFIEPPALVSIRPPCAPLLSHPTDFAKCNRNTFGYETLLHLIKPGREYKDVFILRAMGFRCAGVCDVERRVLCAVQVFDFFQVPADHGFGVRNGRGVKNGFRHDSLL